MSFIVGGKKLQLKSKAKFIDMLFCGLSIASSTYTFMYALSHSHSHTHTPETPLKLNLFNCISFYFGHYTQAYERTHVHTHNYFHFYRPVVITHSGLKQATQQACRRLPHTRPPSKLKKTVNFNSTNDTHKLFVFECRYVS